MKQNMVKNSLMIFSLIAVLLGSALPASARPVDCLLEVDGKTYIKGICEFASLGGGSFSLTSKEYFLFLRLNDADKNSASVNWNAAPDSTHAQAYVGEVYRKGACWEGKRAKVCARGLSAAKQAKIEAARPAGEMINILETGYPNVCLQKGSFEYGTRLILGYSACNSDMGYAPKLFKRSIDNIVIDKHPNLCIDAVPTGKANESMLVLADCKSVANKWHLFNGAIHSSSKNLCWSISEFDPGGPVFVYMMAVPCKKNINENRLFEFYKGE